MARIDLNSDLGESFGVWRLGNDEAVLQAVSSANLACGFHAGDPAIMLDGCRAAAAAGVTVGAHPSYRDLVGFGRRAVDIAADDLFADVLYQVAALQGIAVSVGTAVRYLKPHGALYGRIGTDEGQADAVARAAAALGLPLLGMPGTVIERAAAAHGVGFVTEAFVDRGYLASGALAPRGMPGALVTDPAAAADRASRMLRDGVVDALDGGLVEVRAASLCVHGDTPNAAGIVRAVRTRLEADGHEIGAFA